MAQYKSMVFFNGDVYDIRQTINGISKFILIDDKWCYYSNRLMKEYEYSQEELTEMIYQKYVEWEEIKYLGNIFHHIRD